jgi:hypothetical protein
MHQPRAKEEPTMKTLTRTVALVAALALPGLAFADTPAPKPADSAKVDTASRKKAASTAPKAASTKHAKHAKKGGSAPATSGTGSGTETK